MSILSSILVLLALNVTDQKIGIFEAHSDIGELHPDQRGSVVFEEKAKTYMVHGSGSNMWFDKDAFHFAYKKVSGDQSIEAEIRFLSKTKNPHAKACLIVRQSLDADSAYADIALHADGLTSLQYRDSKGGTTHEIQASLSKPFLSKLTKRGNTVIASLNGTYSGASIKLDLQEPYYIGIGVCSHEANLAETAEFNKVAIEEQQLGAGTLFSTLETVDIASTDRRVVHVFAEHMEAPNWTPDGKTLIYNSQGLLYKIPWIGGRIEKIDTGFATRCNNDHGISPDGRTIVISDQSQDDHQSVIYTLPVGGLSDYAGTATGTPKRITEHSPSYWHGWSPDGKTLAYCAQRNGKFGIFTIPVDGGSETRLTTADAGKLDDGPDYSPDGTHVIFNSDRTGKMQLYQMNPDGTGVEQITKDERNNWFGHVSPDSKWMVYVSYEPDVKGHPANKDVELRLMNMADHKKKTLAKLFGGQGTINVPSWSPDSKRVAFVSYQFVG